MPSLELSVLNQDHNPQDNILFVGEAVRLQLVLTNKTGQTLTLRSQGKASTFSVHFPPEQFSEEVRATMSIELAGWDFSREEGKLLLTFAGAEGSSWAPGAAFSCSVAGVLSKAQPSPSVYVSLGIAGIEGTPKQLRGQLVLMNPPQKGNPSLRHWLSVSLDDRTVYVSRTEGEKTDPISNTLSLNIKNEGDTKLYSGAKTWHDGPQVLVAFVYGSTSGALASDDDAGAPALGSAWNIRAEPSVVQSGWGAEDADRTGNSSHPGWKLTPDSSINQAILGARDTDTANVTFAFKRIVSFTPIGHTQMILLFSGFKQDDTRRYDDAVFVLDIEKRLAPPSERGVTDFSGPPELEVKAARQPFSVKLSFDVRRVASITIGCDHAGFKPHSKSYSADGPPSQSDTYDAPIDGITSSRTLTFTIQAFDGLGALVGSRQHSVSLELQAFVDSDGKTYKILRVGHLAWMAENLARQSGIPFKGHEAEVATHGRLFTAEQARAFQPPEGWRLPSLEEWQELVTKFGPEPSKAYAALLAGSSSGFDARLAGRSDDAGVFSAFDERGYYWTSARDDDSASTHCVVFSSLSKSVAVSDNTVPDNWTASVRFVREG